MDDHFWWGWWVDAIAAFATVLAVVVALFGSSIQARLFKPKLRLALLSRSGELVPITAADSSGTSLARYYHLRLSNEASWPPATQVQVFLTRVEEPGPDGVMQAVWASEVPLQWRFQEVNPISRTVGAEAHADLCSVVKDGPFQLHPLVFPNALIPLAQRFTPFQARLTIEARSAEVTTPPTQLQISWDGLWHDGEKEMASHLVISQL